MSDIPGYTILRPLGQGGMATVYLALQQSLGREVALKILSPTLAQDATATQRFLREARLAANLHHPNIVPIYDVGIHDGTPYMAMEYVPGGNVVPAAGAASDPDGVLRTVRDIAGALDHAHRQGVIHRDIKPENILRQTSGSCMLSDFGIARTIESTTALTREGETVGTPHYMSPEHLRGQPVDGRSDLYSLGVVLYQLLTGKLPYSGTDSWAIGTQHISAPIPRMPGPLERLQPLVDGLMAKEPAARPQSGADVVHQIEALLAGATATPTISLQAAAPMPSRRKPWPAGAAIALPILALLLAIGGGLFWRSQMRGPIVAAPRPPSSAPAATVLATSAIPDKSIAVLPFENLSGRAEDAYLADGLQEEILNALARVRDLKVISRTSVQEYRGKSLNVREIGQRLGVRTVLEGSVRLQGPTLRLTIQLIDARDDHHLLATNYDRKLTNVLDLQSTVARLVANALSATLTRYEHGEFERIATNSGDAYDRYLHAQALFRRPTPEDDSGVVESKRLLDEALVFDPDYADALAMLSQANTWIYFGSNDPAAGAAAKQAFERAFVLDPDLPEARLARGIYAMYVTKDMDQAMSDLDAVVALRPNSSEAHQLLGFALRRRGSMVEAIQHLTRAWDLDPLNPARDGGPLITLLGLRRYPEAIEQTRIDSARFPNEAGSYFVRARLLGRLQHSLAPLRAALRDHGSLLDAPSHKAIEAEIAQAEGRFQDAIALLGQSPAYVPMVRARRIGMLYYAAGDPARARRTLQDAERVEEAKRPQDVSIDGLRNLAVVQSLLGQHDAALASIERARSQTPEATDVVNGPSISFDRAIILVRAGRGDEGYAEATRLLRVPFGAPFFDLFGPRDSWELMPEARDPRFAVLINDPPRL